MSLVNNIQLQEILEDLLAKIKTNTESTYNNITFNDSNNSLELTSINGNTTSCSLNGLVDIDSEQVITGSKVFKNITIDGGEGVRFFNDTPADHTATNNSHYCGTSSISFEAGTFIEEIIVILNENNVNPGDIVDGVNVYSAHGDYVRVINYQNASFEAIENPYPDNIDGTVAVRIPMNIRLDVNTWFLLGARHMKWARAHTTTYAAGGNTFLSVGQHLPQTIGNYLCKVAYVTRNLSVANLISEIPKISDEMGNMFVNAEIQDTNLVLTKQNGTTQTVALSSSAAPNIINLNFDDSNTDLNSEDVVSAIKETYSTLKNMIDNVSTSFTNRRIQDSPIESNHIIGEVIYLLKDSKEHITGNSVYLKCDGSKVLSSEYPELATIINKTKKKNIILPSIDSNNGTYAYVRAK